MALDTTFTHLIIIIVRLRIYLNDQVRRERVMILIFILDSYFILVFDKYSYAILFIKTFKPNVIAHVNFIANVDLYHKIEGQKALVIYSICFRKVNRSLTPCK